MNKVESSLLVYLLLLVYGVQLNIIVASYAFPGWIVKLVFSEQSCGVTIDSVTPTAPLSPTTPSNRTNPTSARGPTSKRWSSKQPSSTTTSSSTASAQLFSTTAAPTERVSCSQQLLYNKAGRLFATAATPELVGYSQQLLQQSW